MYQFSFKHSQKTPVSYFSFSERSIRETTLWQSTMTNDDRSARLWLLFWKWVRLSSGLLSAVSEWVRSFSISRSTIRQEVRTSGEGGEYVLTGGGTFAGGRRRHTGVHAAFAGWTERGIRRARRLRCLLNGMQSPPTRRTAGVRRRGNGADPAWGLRVLEVKICCLQRLLWIALLNNYQQPTTWLDINLAIVRSIKWDRCCVIALTVTE